jgi:hypothetical protein
MSHGIKFLIFLSFAAEVLIGSRQVLASDSVPESGIYGVCASHASGLSVSAKYGIDGVDGTVTAGAAAANFSFGTSPNLPEAMGVKKGKYGYVLPPISDDLTFIAESRGALEVGYKGAPIGYGVERLYAFNALQVTPNGPVKHVVYLQIRAEEREKDIELLKRFAANLYRCTTNRNERKG